MHFASADPNFGRGVALTGDGHIVIAGGTGPDNDYYSYSNHIKTGDIAVARLNADGSLDTAFAASGRFPLACR